MKLKINIKNLSKNFDGKVIFKNLNLKIFQSESLAIIGQSGSGKSVLTKCITGLLRFEKGEIFFDNDYEISGLSNYNLLKHTAKFGFLFQSAALFDSLTVKENILFKLNSSDYEEILNKVGLDKSISSKYPAELSVGVQKRVGLARAIISKPEILIFDEPTTGLDPIMAYQINKLLKKLVVDYKLTTITITHDMESVYEFADKVAFIDQGSISWYGKVGQINLNKNKQLFNFINGIN